MIVGSHNQLKQLRFASFLREQENLCFLFQKSKKERCWTQM